MAGKVNMSQLRKAVSLRTGASEKEVSIFFSAFTDTIEEGLRKDGQVRLNGLGTFSLKAVAPRKSVNVATGEPIMLEGYNKVTFTPESSMKDIVNRPLAVEQAKDEAGRKTTKKKVKGEETPIDPLQRLGEQAEEIVGILAELNTMTSPLQEETEVVSKEESIEEPKDQLVADTEELNVAGTQESGVNEEVVPVPVQEKFEPQIVQPPFHPWRTAFITLGIFCVLLCGVYLFLRQQVVNWADSLLVKTENVTPAYEPKPVTLPQELPPMESRMTERNDTISISNSDEGDADSMVTEAAMSVATRTYDELLAIETVNEGSRLSWLAWRYYKRKDLWVFIYEANKDKLKNPNLLPAGEKIRIPKLPQDWIDGTNTEIEKLIPQLKEEFKKRA